MDQRYSYTHLTDGEMEAYRLSDLPKVTQLDSDRHTDGTTSAGLHSLCLVVSHEWQKTPGPEVRQSLAKAWPPMWVLPELSHR